jgi:hypothetical protein
VIKLPTDGSLYAPDSFESCGTRNSVVTLGEVLTYGAIAVWSARDSRNSSSSKIITSMQSSMLCGPVFIQSSRSRLYFFSPPKQARPFRDQSIP